MSITFPFPMGCQLLDVDSETLQRWLEEAGIEPTSPSTENRLKRLTLEQIYRLAVLYRESQYFAYCYAARVQQKKCARPA
jgi:predicted site-specific integrase-resolvase